MKESLFARFILTSDGVTLYLYGKEASYPLFYGVLSLDSWIFYHGFMENGNMVKKIVMNSGHFSH